MKDPDHFALPIAAHIPGSGTLPDQGLLDSIIALTPALTETTTAVDNATWRYGLILFNAGFFWEAHEVLEAVWLNARQNSREQHLVQGIIHLANAALKQRMHREQATIRLRALASASFARAFPSTLDPLMGLTAQTVQAAVSTAELGSIPLITQFQIE